MPPGDGVQGAGVAAGMVVGQGVALQGGRLRNAGRLGLFQGRLAHPELS